MLRPLYLFLVSVCKLQQSVTCNRFIFFSRKSACASATSNGILKSATWPEMARKRGMEDAPQAKNKAEGGNKKKKGSDDAPAVDEEETVTATTSQSLYDVNSRAVTPMSGESLCL